MPSLKLADFQEHAGLDSVLRHKNVRANRLASFSSALGASAGDFWRPGVGNVGYSARVVGFARAGGLQPVDDADIDVRPDASVLSRRTFRSDSRKSRLRS
jgi:hypothetical protein